jgi:fructose-1,6-bisphosphatase/inositol monophosphatase family enzyme
MGLPSLQSHQIGILGTAALASVGCWLLLKKHVRSDNKETESDKSQYNIPQELDSCPYRDEVNVAVKLALQCGSNMYGYCNDKGTASEGKHDLGINTKGQDENFCTLLDIENERIVVDGIRNVFPQHDIIGEESVGTGIIPRINANVPTWIVDPIDGTTNFASGLPLTCVSIGLCVEGKPTLGVVYAPMTEEFYIGVKGYGCYRNGILISKRRKEINKIMKESVVCTEFGYTRDKDGIDKMISAVQRILYNGCRTTRQFGSGVLNLCYVATGRIDIVYAGIAGEGWKPWDYCAGMVIAIEAGCTIESFTQNSDDEFDIYSDSVICAVNSSLVKEFRQIVLDEVTTTTTVNSTLIQI